MKEILIEKNMFYFRGYKYEEKDIVLLITKMGKNLRIGILAENILIRTIKGNNLENSLKIYEIENIKDDDDTLVHYNYNKSKNELYIYSIKQGKRIMKITANINKLCVYPVQFKIKKIIEKKKKGLRNYIAIVMVNNYGYIIEVCEKQLILASVNAIEEFNFKNALLNFRNPESIIIDEQLQKQFEEITIYKNATIISMCFKEII